jgi:hypothetical protein
MRLFFSSSVIRRQAKGILGVDVTRPSGATQSM